MRGGRSEEMHVARASITPSSSSSSLSSSSSSPSPRRLPLEGQLYDPVTLSNFIDLDKYKLTASLSKSIAVNALSTVLDADLPAKVTVSGKLGTAWMDGVKMEPVGRVGLNVRLLDLGASDSRQKGYLRFKASARTDGRRDHGFEIDRKVELFSLPNTTLYGNVSYKTTNKSRGEWKTTSSFGLHQDMRFGGLKFAARIGLTPEGDFVYDLKL